MVRVAVVEKYTTDADGTAPQNELFEIVTLHFLMKGLVLQCFSDSLMTDYHQPGYVQISIPLGNIFFL